jgi:hypothetical protein
MIARSSMARSDATAQEVRGMAPKHHPAPLSGGDRKALKKELSKSRAMTRIFAERWAEKRREGEALIREAGNLACQSWNERMWSDGGPINPSPPIDQAINGGYPWLEIECSRCQTPRDVDLAALRHVPTTCVHDLAGRLVCQKCKKVGKRPAPTMLQLARARVSRREKLNAKLKSGFRCYPAPTTDMRRLHGYVRFVPEAEVIGAFGHGVELLPTTARGTLRAIL